MLPLKCLYLTTRRQIADRVEIDYEQQRLYLLHEHGIDFDDFTSLVDGKKTRRMDAKEAELLLLCVHPAAFQWFMTIDLPACYIRSCGTNPCSKLLVVVSFLDT